MKDKSNKKGDDKPKMGIVKDPRFERIHVDPRFKRFPKKDAKVEIDDRFAKMFTDDRFQMKSSVDKRGRKVQQEKKSDDIKRYYRLRDEQEQLARMKGEKEAGEEHEAEGEEETDEEAPKAKQRKAAKGKTQVRRQEVEESEEEESQGEEEDEEDEVQRRWNRLRGLADVSSSSDEDGEGQEEGVDGELPDWADEVDEDEEAKYLEMVGGKETWGVGVYAINKALEEVPGSDATRRLAIVDLDWTRLKAVDIFAALNSFVPKGGRLLKVTVYPSDYGLERMKEEETRGPQGIWTKGKKDEEEDDEEEEEGEGKEIVNERLRAYERSKLRWYYAVAEFDSVQCANAVYEQCDGMEFGRSSNVFDLRFVPEEQDFSARQVRESATSVPRDYEPPVYETKALQHTNVQLTWDQDDPSRRKTLHKKVTEKDLKEEDFKAYLASSGSEEEDEGEDPEAIRARYRALLLGETGGKKGKKGGEEEDEEEEGEGRGGARKEKEGEMMVTFDSGLETLGKRLLEKKKEEQARAGETVWESYLRKKKEKRQERKRQGRRDSDSDDSAGDTEEEDAFVLAENGGKDGDDDFFIDDQAPKKGGKKDKKGAKAAAAPEQQEDEEDPFNDPFFTENAAFDDAANSESEEEGEGAGRRRAVTKTAGDKGAKKGRRAEDGGEEERRQKAELELLLLDEGALRGAAQGDRLALRAGTSQGTEAAEGGPTKKKGKKQFKRAKDRRAEEFSDDEDLAKDQGEDFQLDLQDPRFNRLLTSHNFALDPTDPRFKATESSKKIIQEAARARKKANSQGPQAAAREKQQAAEDREGQREKGDLRLLVANLKRKTAGGGGHAPAPKKPRA